MRMWRSLFALPALCAAGSGSIDLDFDKLEAIANRQACELEHQRVVYAGDSSLLGACLERLGQRGDVPELRITSGGGDAWVTLQLARELRGRLDLLVVQDLCASSCANYLLPVARRVRVEPHAHVLLHGSLSQRDATNQHEALRESMRKQLRALHDKVRSDAEIEVEAEKAVTTLHAYLAERIPVQDAFARELLACGDWLDIWEHFGGHEPPKGTFWVLVTPEMAARCLKLAKIVAFWPPEPQQAFDPQLGFFRALE